MHWTSTKKGPLTYAMDIGCGTGQSTEHLLSHFEKVYGCDPSQAMLDQAKEDYKNHGNIYCYKSFQKTLSWTFKDQRDLRTESIF